MTMQRTKQYIRVSKHEPLDGNPKAWVGIDPGVTGAIALITEQMVCFVKDFEDANITAEWFEFFKSLTDIQWVAIERVHAMPKQGVSSTFKFGTNFGIHLGIVASFKLPLLLPRPAEWKKGLVRKTDGKDIKERSLNVARRMFPQMNEFFTRVKDHNRAEALLIAYYAKQQG